MGSLDFARDDVLSLVDAASFAAHKFYGPKGAGFLFLRSGIPIEPIHFGGAHENQRRPGTENVAAIAGMAAAAEFVERDREQEQARERNLRDQLWQEISAQISPVVLNGDTHRRLANTLNISLPALDSETMLMALDLEGVCASSGSACMVGSVVASHVLSGDGVAARPCPISHPFFHRKIHDRRRNLSDGWDCFRDCAANECETQRENGLRLGSSNSFSTRR